MDGAFTIPITALSIILITVHIIIHTIILTSVHFMITTIHFIIEDLIMEGEIIMLIKDLKTKEINPFLNQIVVEEKKITLTQKQIIMKFLQTPKMNPTLN